MGFENDASVAHELVLFIDNDAQLYRSQHTPIIKNLMTKHAQGRYNSALAVKLFMYLVDNGAKKYAKEHGGPGAKWNDMFPKAVRVKAAEALRDSFEGEAEVGGYDDLIPKKYQGKVSGKTIKEGREPQGEPVAEDGPLFDGETRKALTEAAGSALSESRMTPYVETAINDWNRAQMSLHAMSQAYNDDPVPSAETEKLMGEIGKLFGKAMSGGNGMTALKKLSAALKKEGRAFRRQYGPEANT